MSVKFLHAASGSSDKSRTTREFATDAWEEIRMDENPEVNPDIQADMLHMDSVTQATFDAVYTAYSLERLFPHDVLPALRNLHRVLKNEGYLVVSCADLRSACALIANDKLLEPAYDSPAGPVAPIDILYGFRPALAAGYVRHANKCGFTARALTGTLAQAGFGSIWTAVNAPTYTITAIASKKERPETEMRELAKTHFAR
ncbi:MAG: class I SAM-dependent methyltransferase [Desulfovibrio sp.]|jgi:SAM-dependent methyltransferase|nr:class I SAM-dependent methyltransferase [Desulfovibrio sp.]